MIVQMLFVGSTRKRVKKVSSWVRLYSGLDADRENDECKLLRMAHGHGFFFSAAEFCPTRRMYVLAKNYEAVRSNVLARSC
jgi:hypothetical protein